MVDPAKFVEEQVREIRAKVTGPAIIACSGGVDSVVASVLVARAVPQYLTAVFVDTGFMRKDEPAQVKRLLEQAGVKLDFVDARDRFFEALKGVTDPEHKRKTIGALFIRIFEEEAAKSDAKFLVQGTIAPDWIESGGGIRDTIKSHHNVGGLPKDMKLVLVEPLRDLYKDEVRAVARHLGLPVSERQPFPGPGLAVRILGECTPERADIVREACFVVEDEIERAVDEGRMERPWQYFAAYLPVRSVGVHGDVRHYGATIVVRIVESLDAMTANAMHLPWDVLDRISTRITNTLAQHVTRVVYLSLIHI